MNDESEILDIPGALLHFGRGPPRDVDGGPGLAQLQGDAAPDPPGGSGDQTNLALQRR